MDKQNIAPRKKLLRIFAIVIVRDDMTAPQ